MSGDSIQEKTWGHTLAQIRHFHAVANVLHPDLISKVGNTTHLPTSNELVGVEERSMAKL